MTAICRLLQEGHGGAVMRWAVQAAQHSTAAGVAGAALSSQLPADQPDIPAGLLPSQAAGPVPPEVPDGGEWTGQGPRTNTVCLPAAARREGP